MAHGLEKWRNRSNQRVFDQTVQEGQLSNRHANAAHAFQTEMQILNVKKKLRARSGSVQQ